MVSIRIGIVGYKDEDHTELMAGILRDKNVEPVVIDTLYFPEEIPFSYREGNVKYNSASIDDIKTFYVRTVYISLPVYQLPDEEHKLLDDWKFMYLATREKHSFLASWLRAQKFQGKNVINPTETFDLHFLKLYQLELLRKNKISVPKTLVTNSKDEVLEFRNEVKQMVYKPVGGGAECEILKDEDFAPERMQLLKNAPVIFQEYIPGDNIRVYVIEDKIISAGIIHTQHVDYRAGEEKIEKIKLPGNVEKMCLSAAKVCGMKFSGIDIKKKNKDDFVLIECNPSPMFKGFSERTGDNIGEALSEYLIKLTR